MDALRDAVPQRRHDGIRGREVHGYLGSGALELGERIADVDDGGQVEICGGIQGPDDFGAHASGGADDPNLDHAASLVGLRGCNTSRGPP